ncbi:DUF397 domain-containing protein [Streptomyces sp. INA 01156]
MAENDDHRAHPLRTQPVVLVQEQLQRVGGGDCVEVATASTTVHVRDSKNRALPSISVGAEQWAAFVGFAADQ